MEAGRTRWTDDRIDDLVLALREEMRDMRLEMREGFRDVRADIRDLRGEIGGVRADLSGADRRSARRPSRGEIGGVRGEIGGLRADTDASFRTVYAQLGLERRWLVGMWLTTALGFVALLVELHVR